MHPSTVPLDTVTQSMDFHLTVVQKKSSMGGFVYGLESQSD